MNVAFPRFLKSAYRKEPISSFMMTVGAVDAVLGGFEDRWLLTFGVGTVGLAIALRWWLQRTPDQQADQVPVHYLPSRSSSTQLPILMNSKNHPPR